MLQKWLFTALIALVVTGPAFGRLEFADDFENNPLVASGSPEDWTVFGAPILDRGTLHNGENHSPTASVWVAVSWSSWGWGALVDSNETTRYNLSDDRATISCWMRATNDFAAGSVAFTVFDEDGTQWRTANADQFQLTTEWTQYSTSLSNMQVEAAGNTAGLDVTNIVNFGFLSYTAGQTGGNMVQFDDFEVVAVPEPSALGLIALGFSALYVTVRRRRS